MPAGWDRLLTAGRAPKFGLPALFACDLKPAIRKASGIRLELGREPTVGFRELGGPTFGRTNDIVGSRW